MTIRLPLDAAPEPPVGTTTVVVIVLIALSVLAVVLCAAAIRKALRDRRGGRPGR